MRRGQKTSAEQVVLKLRQIEVQTGQGKSSRAFRRSGRRFGDKKARHSKW